MDVPPKRRTVIFIVRVWAEYLSEQSLCWRGVIEMVGKGRKKQFSHLEDIVEFIRKQTSAQINTEDKP
jgi:hypothetical protein